MEMKRRAVILTIASFGLAGCRDFGSADCPSDLRARFAPTDTAIAVNDDFVASVQLFGCAGTKKLSDSFVWRTQDSSVATVDSVTGHVSGRNAGETRITATARQYGVVGGLRVVVQAPVP